MARKNKNQQSNGSSDAGVALISNILGNLSKHPELRTTVIALQNVIADWRTSYQSLDNQLELALIANSALNEQVSTLRNNLRSTQDRVYAAEQWTLATEKEIQATRERLAQAEERIVDEDAEFCRRIGVDPEPEHIGGSPDGEEARGQKQESFSGMSYSINKRN